MLIVELYKIIFLQIFSSIFIPDIMHLLVYVLNGVKMMVFLEYFGENRILVQSNCLFSSSACSVLCFFSKRLNTSSQTNDLR